MSKDKMYITANELAMLLGISVGHSYKLIHQLNEELKNNGYLVISGKIPMKYLEERWYGFER